jgi:hypothetical protein
MCRASGDSTFDSLFYRLVDADCSILRRSFHLYMAHVNGTETAFNLQNGRRRISTNYNSFRTHLLSSFFSTLRRIIGNRPTTVILHLRPLSRDLPLPHCQRPGDVLRGTPGHFQCQKSPISFLDVFSGGRVPDDDGFYRPRLLHGPRPDQYPP